MSTTPARASAATAATTARRACRLDCLAAGSMYSSSSSSSSALSASLCKTLAYDMASGGDCAQNRGCCLSLLFGGQEEISGPLAVHDRLSGPAWRVPLRGSREPACAPPRDAQCKARFSSATHPARLAGAMALPAWVVALPRSSTTPRSALPPRSRPRQLGRGRTQIDDARERARTATRLSGPLSSGRPGAGAARQAIGPAVAAAVAPAVALHCVGLWCWERGGGQRP
mmetsp:Transcript_12478/g.31798  ORF Transcript_12478/g.31798 Transcript_12478/m.31798 type:complete len:228 (-) Transcript_12478:369-1052(-)